MTSHIYDLIIIGSGPAGLAAAVYAQRACLDTLIIERSTVSGGQILNTYEVDNYPGYPGISGYELGMKLREHADHLGALFKEDTVLRLLRCIPRNIDINVKSLMEDLNVLFGGVGVESRREIEHRWTLIIAGVYRKDKEA